MSVWSRVYKIPQIFQKLNVSPKYFEIKENYLKKGFLTFFGVSNRFH